MGMNTVGSLLIGVVLSAALLDGCRRDATRDADEVRRVVGSWLRCEECVDGELEAVVQLGAAAVPVLSGALRDGPSQARRGQWRRILEERYAALRAYASTDPTARLDLSRDEYVQIYMDNFVALHRIRAARALGGIGGSAALSPP